MVERNKEKLDEWDKKDMKLKQYLVLISLQLLKAAGETFSNTKVEFW